MMLVFGKLQEWPLISYLTLENLPKEESIRYIDTQTHNALQERLCIIAKLLTLI